MPYEMLPKRDRIKDDIEFINYYDVFYNDLGEEPDVMLSRLMFCKEYLKY
jgi:hypothetical protein